MVGLERKTKGIVLEPKDVACILQRKNTNQHNILNSNRTSTIKLQYEIKREFNIEISNDIDF